jgi:hypothetical protein
MIVLLRELGDIHISDWGYYRLFDVGGGGEKGERRVVEGVKEIILCYKCMIRLCFKINLGAKINFPMVGRFYTFPCEMSPCLLVFLGFLG